jgi:hypothetical protein
MVGLRIAMLLLVVNLESLVRRGNFTEALILPSSIPKSNLGYTGCRPIYPVMTSVPWNGF